MKQAMADRWSKLHPDTADDAFFQERLAHLRKSREFLEKKRRLLKQRKSDALSSYRRIHLQLREDRDSVAAIKELSSNVLLRIAEGMKFFQDQRMVAPVNNHFTVDMDSVIYSETIPSVLPCPSPPKGKGFSTPFSYQAPSRPIGKSDFVRGIGRPNTRNPLAEQRISGSNEEDIEETVTAETVKQNVDDKPASPVPVGADMDHDVYVGAEAGSEADVYALEEVEADRIVMEQASAAETVCNYTEMDVNNDALASSSSQTKSGVLNNRVIENLTKHEDDELVEEHSSGENAEPSEHVISHQFVETASSASKNDAASEQSELDTLVEELNPSSLLEISSDENDKHIASSPVHEFEISKELMALGRLTSIEKLSVLCTLINTMHFWEDEVMLDGSWDIPGLVYSLIDAARESQNALFKLLESTRDCSRPALCCYAVCELVKAYPPEKLLPRDFLQRLLSDEKNATDNLSLYQDAESANFWEMLMAFAISLMDEHGNTIEQVGSMLVQALLPSVAFAQGIDEGRVVLHLFLVLHLCGRIMYKEATNATKEKTEDRCDSTGTRSSFQSKVDCSDNEASTSPIHEIGQSRVLKLETPKKTHKMTNQTKGLWSSVGGFVVKSFAWRKRSQRSRKLLPCTKAQHNRSEDFHSIPSCSSTGGN